MSFFSKLFNEPKPKSFTAPPQETSRIISADIHQIKVKIKHFNESTGGSPLYRHIYELLDHDHNKQISALQKRHGYNVADSNSAYHKQLAALKIVHVNEFSGLLDMMTNNYTLGQVRQVFAPKKRLQSTNSTTNESRQTTLSSAYESSASDDVPEWMLDPISFDILRDPVVTPSGITYEKATLMECLQKNGYKDPITRTSLHAVDLVPNLALKESVRQYIQEKLENKIEL